MLRSSIVTSPDVIVIRRFTICMAVVLPLPDGPIRTQISPAGTSRVRFETAGVRRPGYTLVVSWNARTAVAAPSEVADGPGGWAESELFKRTVPQGGCDPTSDRSRGPGPFA